MVLTKFSSASLVVISWNIYVNDKTFIHVGRGYLTAVCNSSHVRHQFMNEDALLNLFHFLLQPNSFVNINSQPQLHVCSFVHSLVHRTH